MAARSPEATLLRPSPINAQAPDATLSEPPISAAAKPLTALQRPPTSTAEFTLVGVVKSCPRRLPDYWIRRKPLMLARLLHSSKVSCLFAADGRRTGCLCPRNRRRRP